MINIFLPDSKGNGIKPGTVHGSDAPGFEAGGMMIFEPEPSAPEASASLTVVGDSDQSIYAFRGADIRNISEFEKDYPGAKVVLLEQNYRSTQNILSAANAVIGHNFDRKDKKLWTDVGEGEKIIGFTGYSQHDEAQFVADEIETLHRGGVDYSQIAVFYRTNSQSRALEEIFIRAALPYKMRPRPVPLLPRMHSFENREHSRGEREHSRGEREHSRESGVP